MAFQLDARFEQITRGAHHALHAPVTLRLVIVREVDAENGGGELVHGSRFQLAEIQTYCGRARNVRRLNASVTFCLYRNLHSLFMDDIEDHSVPAWQVEGTLAAAERAAITSALAHCGNSRTQAAIRLRCGRSSLYLKMEEYEIMVPSRSASSLPQPEPHEQQPVVVMDNGQYVLVRLRETA